MDLKGRLIDIVKDWLTGEFKITFGMLSVPSGIDDFRDKDLRISLKKWSEKRSLTANAYYWVLVGKIAEKIEASQAAVHNILLRRYGQLEYIDDVMVTILIPDTEEAEEKALNAETYHIKPTSHTRVGNNGVVFRLYRMLKGSSEYDSKEMATLIDGAVAEAKHMGIETLPEDELRRMKDALNNPD